MPTSPYIDGTGLQRQRSLASGDGSTGTPDVADFAPKYLNDSPITGASMPSGGAGTHGWLSGIWKFLNDRLTTLGQKTKSGSMPVVIASDQDAIAITGSITATNPSVGTTGSATPAFGTTIAASDGTNLLALRATTSTPSGSEAGLIVRNILEKPAITFVTGTISSSGDNTIVSAPGSGLSIYITYLVLQNESSTATTIILKDSANRLRCLGQSQGSSLALTFPERRELKLATNTALILNLSGANSCGYSIGYYTGA